jgi:hypothetical protein
MKPSERAYVRTTAREFAVLAVAALGAYLFFIHGSLYLQAGSEARPLTLEGFFLVTTILYLLLRLIFVVAGLYYPRPRTEYTVCAECGREIEKSAPDAADRHRRVTLSPRPTEKEVMAAILLRKAIDDARRTAQKPLSGPEETVVRLPGNVENLPVPVDEFERILHELDHPRDGRGSVERRPRGPAGPPP